MAEDAENRDRGKVIPLTRRRRCPICGRPQVHAYRPFCSQRCADQDLGRWLTGGYRIAADEEADVDEEPDGGN
ncbi:MAG: DNA gyrase inhibitor YacG [Rhodospirillales bacterium]|jgi:endogenous inhibitor of DNA gyrase (YacG/DUF329 family)|nr:DNA gyrase inhibitor YacG [Rhodospirillales bacterium]